MSNYKLVKNESVSNKDFVATITSLKFKNYVGSLSEDITVDSIIIEYVRMFGGRVGFAVLEVNATQTFMRGGKKCKKKIPGCVFLRGNSVACLTLLKRKEDNKLFQVLVNQYKIPTGGRVFEAPAGMMDEDNNMTGTMIKEIKEEIDLDIKNPKKLGEFWPSQGGCDEKLGVFYVVVEKTKAEIEAMQGKLQMNTATEVIFVEIRPFSVEEVLKTEDSKLMAATLMLMHKHGITPQGQFTMASGN